jgi:hypothetical protein
MKNQFIKIPLFIITAALLLSGTACKKSFFSDVNNNPNAPDPKNIMPNVLLPTVEASLSYSMGGECSRYASILTQQTKGAFNQAAAYESYVFTTNDFDASWGNLYTSVLENNIKLQEICDAKGYNRYGGISRVLTAYTLQLIVDAWGAAPYSKALKGDANLKPTFDNGQGLYDTAQNLLNRAITLLNNSSPGVLVPGADDFIYGGDQSLWIKFAHAIKARLYIHQSKGNATMAANALAEANLSFTSNADNAQFVFSTVETAANPWYQFNQQRGLIFFAPDASINVDAATMYDEMDASGDPRFSVFFDPTFSDPYLVGTGSYYGSANSPVELISLDEILFIKAEATLRNGGTLLAAQAFYRQGIDSNMVKLGIGAIDRATYIALHGTLIGTTANAIAQVAAEEYIALFLNPEVWTLWRRTGSPVRSATVGSNIPRRFLYPQSEISNNGANTPASTLQTPKIFWDN